MCDELGVFFKQKTAYEMRISDLSSDVFSSDLFGNHLRCPVQILTSRHQSDRRAIPGNDARSINCQLVLDRVYRRRISLFTFLRQVDLDRMGLDRDGNDKHDE